MLAKNRKEKGANGAVKKPEKPRIARFMPVVLVLMMLGSTVLIGIGSSDEFYPDSPEIEKMSVSAEIDNNYAVTEISEVLWNPYDAAVSATFSFEIPEKAFISNFSMTVNGEITYAKIVSKEQGQEEFQEAVMNGTNAGLVESYGKNIFSYSVSLSAYERMGICLRYEEFLEKSLGGYEYRVPMADSGIYYFVGDFSVNIHLESGIVISSADVENYPATLNWVSPKELEVSYEYASTYDECASGCIMPFDDFILNYELESLPANGRMLNYLDGNEGYFMHIFSPQRSDIGGKSMPKDIIFVLDKSGSMSGEKIEQLKDAFSEIIWQLPEQDNFNIILFDSQISIYSDGLLSASEENRTEAVNYINNIVAGGSTNINDAMTTALGMFEISETRMPIVVMLTDGLPTSGVTNTAAIRENVLDANDARVSVFCLGFGYDVDFDFLKAMALENGGIAMRIYEGQDAGEQITNFYDTISTPLLRGLNFAYSEGTYEIYPTHVEQLFEGTEVVVVGKYSGEMEEIKSTVTATSWEGTKTFEESFPLNDSTDYGFIPRFWAYAKIRHLLDDIAVNGEEPSLVDNITSLALDYGFVTPYTSLLVKPTIDGGGDYPADGSKDSNGYTVPGYSNSTDSNWISPVPGSGSTSPPPNGAPSGGTKGPLNLPAPDIAPAQSESSSLPIGGIAQIVLLLVGTALAIVGYTKIQRYRLLEQEKREMIYNHIQEHPGEHFRAIQRALGMEVGVLSHHINKLEKGNYIRSRQDGMYRRFYPMNSKIDLKLILSDVEKRILSWVKKHPGTSQRDIADNLKISRKVVNYHLKILNDGGFVRIVKDGRKTLSYPNRDDI